MGKRTPSRKKRREKGSIKKKIKVHNIRPTLGRIIPRGMYFQKIIQSTVRAGREVLKEKRNSLVEKGGGKRKKSFFETPERPA